MLLSKLKTVPFLLIRTVLWRKHAAFYGLIHRPSCGLFSLRLPVFFGLRQVKFSAVIVRRPWPDKRPYFWLKAYAKLTWRDEENWKTSNSEIKLEGACPFMLIFTGKSKKWRFCKLLDLLFSLHAKILEFWKKIVKIFIDR